MPLWEPGLRTGALVACAVLLGETEARLCWVGSPRCPFGDDGSGMGTPRWVQTPRSTLYWGQRDVTGTARPIGGGGRGGFWGAHPLGGGQRVVFPIGETIRLGGRAVPGGEGSGGGTIRAGCQPVRFPLVFLLRDEIRAGHRRKITPRGTRRRGESPSAA